MRCILSLVRPICRALEVIKLLCIISGISPSESGVNSSSRVQLIGSIGR